MNCLKMLGVIFACLVCGLLGLTAGINFNPDSTVRYVPNWGSLGDWVSGVGALLAVATSLYLVRRNEAQQHEREREKIEIEQWAEGFFLSVRVISKGYFPCTVKSVFFVSSDDPGGGAVQLAPYMDEAGRVSLPVRLEIREDIQFVWMVNQLGGLLRALSLLHLRSMDALSIKVVTVTGELIVPISSELSDYLIGAARSEGVDFTFRE